MTAQLGRKEMSSEVALVLCSSTLPDTAQTLENSSPGHFGTMENITGLSTERLGKLNYMTKSLLGTSLPLNKEQTGEKMILQGSTWWWALCKLNLGVSTSCISWFIHRVKYVIHSTDIRVTSTATTGRVCPRGDFTINLQ